MTRFAKTIATLCLMTTSLYANAWDGIVSGTITKIDGVGGSEGAPGNYDIRIYLSGQSTFCSGSPQNWAYLNASDPNYKGLLALLISAQMSGKTVTLYTTYTSGYCLIGYMSVNT